ncbi:hypothetical protein BYT27DRAFT_6741933 [Phlegmacium glaucopus]|nr:hypothetical protein BYT27DRAFT_6741933 [Phlegmacium glaucopus]
MTLSGYMGVKYINSDLQFFMQGDVKHINIPDLSSEPFETDFTLSVEVSDLVPDPEIDLTFQLSTLENAFKCKGLNFNDILFSIGFSVDFPVPSELSACGQVQFCVGEQIFAGSIAFHFDQDSLSHCGVMGSFKTYPSLSQALTGFGSHGQNVPRNVNGTFADLSFHIAPQRFYVGNILVPQGFGLAGSLSLPSPSEFNASFDIEISPTRVHVDGHIKNALVFPTSGPRSFAVFQVSSPSKGPFIDMTITIDSFRCDLSAEVYFLGLSAGISAQISDKGVEIHEFIYAWVGGAKLDIIADKDMFSLSMSCTLALTIPHFLIGTIEFPSIEKAEFALSLGTEVNWSKATWELSITGDLSLFGWDLGRHTFILDVDFTGLEELIRRLEHKIASLFPSHFAMKILHSLEAGVKEVVVVLKSIGLAAIHIGEVLVNHFACGMGEVMKEIGDVFDMAVDDLIPIMKDLGAGLHQVVQILHDWGSDLGSVCGDAALLAKTFGLEVGDVANTVGLVFGKGIDDVRHIMTNVGVDFTNAINTGKQGVKQLLHTVGQVVYRADQVGSQVIHTVGLVGGQVAHTITNTAGQVILTVGQEGNQVVHTVEQVPGATVHTVSQVGGQVVYTVAQVGNEVAGAASGAVDQAIQVTGQAASQVVHTVSQVGNQVNHTVSQVGNDIANAEGNVINFFHPSININIPIF